MAIFLTGASGFIGRHILHMLSMQGYQVTCLLRTTSYRAAMLRQRLQALPGVRIVEGEWTQPESWQHYVADHELVINTVGMIRESHTTRFVQVHTTSAISLFKAASQAHVRKVIQISALGADEQAFSHFHLTKRAADHYLVQSGVPYIILRPSLVYGPGDHSMAFFARMAQLPIIPVPGDGTYRVQPLHIDDLVQATLIGIQRQDLSSVIADIGGNEILTFTQMLDLLTQTSGKSHPSCKLYIPWRLMSALARVTDLLGSHGPITTDELNMLRRENFTSPSRLAQFIDLFGFEPLPFSAGLAARTVSPRQHSLIY